MDGKYPLTGGVQLREGFVYVSCPFNNHSLLK